MLPPPQELWTKKGMAREQNFGTFDVWFGPGLSLAMILPAVPMVYLGKLNQYGMYPNISIMLTSTKCPAAIEIWCGQNPTGPRFGFVFARISSGHAVSRRLRTVSSLPGEPA
jgi:hypothetical protein